MPIRFVVFDIGETLVDETRLWGEWADRLGVSRLAFAAALGALIAQNRPHREVFGLVRPGFDIAGARRERPVAAAICRDDVYPDAVPAITALRAQGYRIGLAGNQARGSEAVLRRLFPEAEFIGSSESWGAEKPSPGFFRRIIELAGLPPGEIAHVGDRLDNDLLPALDAGMVAIFLRRGPWGLIHGARPEAARAHLRLETLAELPGALATIGAR